MSKKIIHQFDPEIYPYKIWIMIGNKDIIKDNFLHYDGRKISDIENTTCGFDAFVMPVRNIENNKYGALISFESKKSMTYNIVAHESSHAAKYLFEHIGCDIKEHEPFEYVIGWIAECCEKVLKFKETKSEKDNS